MRFEETGFAQFMSTVAGRWLRIVLGLALIAWGVTLRGHAGGVVLMVVGLIPLGAGAFDLCVFSLIFGGPVRGAKIRACARPRAPQS